MVSIFYSNTFTYDTNFIRYDYRVARINGTRFQTTEVERQPVGGQHRMLLDRRGIRIVFHQVGELGKFDFPTLLVTVVSGLALVVVASQTLNYTIKWFPPVQKLYRSEIFIDSAGEWGSGAFEVLGEASPPKVEREALPASPSGVLPTLDLEEMLDLEDPCVAPVETADSPESKKRVL